MYIHTHTHTYIHTYTYIHAYIHIHSEAHNVLEYIMSEVGKVVVPHRTKTEIDPSYIQTYIHTYTYTARHTIC